MLATWPARRFGVFWWPVLKVGCLEVRATCSEHQKTLVLLVWLPARALHVLDSTNYSYWCVSEGCLHVAVTYFQHETISVFLTQDKGLLIVIGLPLIWNIYVIVANMRLYLLIAANHS